MNALILILPRSKYKHFSCCQRKPEAWANDANKKICCDFGTGMQSKKYLSIYSYD